MRLPGEVRKGTPARGVRRDGGAAQRARFDAAIGDEAFLCGGILLVEYVIAERVEDRPSRHAFRLLYDVRVMADDEVCAVIDELGRCAALSGVRPVEKLAAPMDEDDDQVREPARETELLA